MQSHIAIPVKNLERSISFYHSLGFEKIGSWERKDWEMRGVMMYRDNAIAIELIDHQKNNSFQYPSIAETLHIGIPVQKLESVLEVAVQNGAKILRPIIEGKTVKRLVFIVDPDGFSLELFEPNA